MNFTPLHDRVLLRRVDAEQRSAGGLYIPESAKEKPQQAEVIAVGPGKLGKDGKAGPMNVQPGDRVLFGKYSGDEIKLGGVEHIVLRESDILAVIA